MTQTAPLLIELFGEEIPARMQAKAVEDFKTLFEKGLKDLNLKFGSIESYITPRRMCINIQDLDLIQPDVKEEKKGPSIDAPEQAIQGFLKSTGLPLEACEKRTLDKGTFYFARLEKKGQATESLIPSLVQSVMDSFAWPKSMRWKESEKTWVRPLHSGICILSEKTIPFKVSFGGGWEISFSNVTYGHRFMAPQAITVRDFEDYQEKLRNHFVILDHRERRQKIEAEAEKIAKDMGLDITGDDKLLDEVTGLVEWPILLIGKIDERFMKLPTPVLITVMRVHQKYFATWDIKNNRIAPYFLIVSNIAPTDGGNAVIEGNERVLRARFADAEFFYKLDQEKPLEEHARKLNEVIFHAQLGTMQEKTARLVELSGFIAQKLKIDVAKAKRAAALCKADLVTALVGEFPDLQGIMGKHYAQSEGEEIADAIKRHYRPRGAEDDIPHLILSRTIALADKIDTLVGFFGIGIKPTSSKDPYALRRAAIGIIRLVEATFRMGLEEFLAFSISLYGARLHISGKELMESLTQFIIERLKAYWKDQGIRYDIVNAVLSQSQVTALYSLKKRAIALEKFIQTPSGSDLLAAYKRAANILRTEEAKDKRIYRGRVDTALLQRQEEIDLHKMLQKSEEPLEFFMQALRFEDAMNALSDLKPYLDAFFDKLTVNDANPSIRENRLNCLASLRLTFEKVADFSKIE